MMARLVSRALVVIAFLMVAASNWPREARAQGVDDLAYLQSQVSQLYDEGKYAEAAPIAELYVALARQKYGDNHTEYATAIAWLAYVSAVHGRDAEAEPLYKRSLAIYEKALGPDHPAVAAALSDLAQLYHAHGRYAEAEPLYKRSLAIREKALGPEHLEVGTVLHYLAALFEAEVRYAEAEPLYKRALAIREKALGPEHPDLATDLNSLAVLYDTQGRYAEAEPLYKRSLAIREKALGPDRPGVAGALSDLAMLYEAEGRDVEAEPLYKRALAILEALGPDHPAVANSLNKLANVYAHQGRYGEAEPLINRALAIAEKTLGSDHPGVAAVLSNLANVYTHQGRSREAEPLMKRALAIREKALRPEHPDVAAALNTLATLYRDQGRYAEAEPLYKRSLAIYEKALGAEHPWVAGALNNFAGLALGQGNWAQAADYWRRATEIIERRAERGLAGSEGGSVKGEAVRLSRYFSGLIKMTDRFAPQGNADRERQERGMFEKAQWAQASDAASSLTQMAARSAKGDTALAKLVRKRQDLVGEWQAKDKRLIAAKSQLPAKRDPDTEKVLIDRLAAIDGRLEAIDAQFAKDFPEYASLTNPKPASVAEVQALLQPNEALVLFLDTDERFKPTPEETFIWVITRGEMRWVKTELGTKTLAQRVKALRCGLDDEEWVGIENPARCAQLLNVAKPQEKDPLPFSIGIAHELYQALFGSVEDLIKDKHLLIVPSGPLTSLPFQVLVTEKPEAALPKSYADYRNVAWLGKRQPLTVLPSVASLRALREFAKGGRGSQDYIGYGDPVLVGDGSCQKITAPETCPSRETAIAQAADQMHQPRSRSVRRSPILTEVYSKGSGSEAVLTQVRALCPLEDTAYEVKCIADSMPKSKIRIRGDATVASIKVLSDSGELATYRVVHFATHGLLAGDVQLMTRLQGEPALVLTPKDSNDNGLLTASKVAELKLNADWVVLSACNTAAGDKLGAEAFSGLARAFFYAGARALLVSHWPVYSDAAVRLTTKAFAEIEADASVTRAEAMRRSMVALMDDESEEDNAHPSVWAPFVLVGEGGR
jgi:CHAT domain-containing protein/tetratricopeptide (TPR) repeat protein